MVGLAGLEPAASCTPCMRASQLRHSPRRQSENVLRMHDRQHTPKNARASIPSSGEPDKGPSSLQMVANKTPEKTCLGGEINRRSCTGAWIFARSAACTCPISAVFAAAFHTHSAYATRSRTRLDQCELRRLAKEESRCKEE